MICQVAHVADRCLVAGVVVMRMVEEKGQVMALTVLRSLVVLLVQQLVLMLMLVQEQEIVKMVLPFILLLSLIVGEMQQLFMMLLLGIRFHNSLSLSPYGSDARYRKIKVPSQNFFTFMLAVTE